MAQTPRELTPHVSLRHFFGAELRHWRLHAGLSHDRLGAEINYSGDLIGKVEKAERAPTLHLAKACDEVLGTGGALARLVGLIDNSAQEAAQETRPACKSGGGTQPAEPITAAALGMPRPDVGAVRAMALAFQTADRQLGGGWVYPTVLRYLQTEIAPALVDAGGADSANMFAAAASLTEIAGWMAHDAGKDTAARAHFGRAYRLATAAASDPLTANVCASLSHLAGQLGQSTDAIRMAEAGLDRVRCRYLSQLVARLHAMRAHGLARKGDRRGTVEALGAAEHTLASAQSAEYAEWIAHFDEGSLAGEVALCLLRLGDLAGAEWAAERAIELRDGDRMRSRAFGQLTLTRVLVHAGRPDEAAVLGSAVCAVAPSLSSARVHTRLAGLGAALGDYREIAEVAAFLGQLAVLRSGATCEDSAWPV